MGQNPNDTYVVVRAYMLNRMSFSKKKKKEETGFVGVAYQSKLIKLIVKSK
jgi:hypothetical protein